MTFNEGASFDTERVTRGGGGGRKIAIGGGAGGLLILILTLLFGGDVGSLLGSGDSGQGQVTDGNVKQIDACNTGAEANERLDCRIDFTARSLDEVWGAELQKQTGVAYDPPKMMLFTASVNTACGPATSDVGPFYCPADYTGYFDTSFFDVLVDRLGSSDGPLAQEYVVAHEVGHHIQNQLGDIGRAQQDPRGPESGAVRTELQADCYAGIWAHFASTVPSAAAGGQPLLNPLTDSDIRDALSAAKSVGDDTIQRSSTGRVNPEGWTHGSSEQRQKWFITGYRTGQVAACNTYDARDLDNPPGFSR
ncbi:neutral zinc metallopeptidase [Antrihabitans sp. YC2-6]|uniref:KPN_02809 family neutral zinc metallopeptidase n=1 Tax=Antrihabitans sp. YC2-6 TaxID=2799498 RepID=UPI0018F4410E|nr:neutral zinc metallopeptidase [Antrihabitans sp. YC2-6]MBJ8345276.1 neutral zinc metallopeptidase [Antrihabitans sp. YC2-6]